MGFGSERHHFKHPSACFSSRNHSGPGDYAAELEIYAQSLPTTYGQPDVQFIYAQPADKLVKGITTPTLPNATSIPIDVWPKNLQELAEKMAQTQKRE